MEKSNQIGNRNIRRNGVGDAPKGISNHNVKIGKPNGVESEARITIL
ncbi:Hypothetical protein LEPBI_I0166 [Leptospira biflexa serovar Patoc strain 'Patoc 1 (Paris)']|uniref:Uncharacterized protein n=1 Tax=Leptospira biflexa serovar Patoc (strain Patoc 1 / ATCC 23582 / Paris) TaxID=456481 RepID=B0SJY9_LEPBP|nr:Hypothetical protein LEPBI_I0166 [Leptospira biflexa serovar Patoc strain 'Patoc 1 (Paris)']